MNENKDIRNVLERLSSWNQRIDFDHPIEKTEDIQVYLDYYGFDLEKVDFHFGKMEIDEKEIAVQIFNPRRSKATVFLLHGYLEHVGYLGNIIQFLNDHHYRVVSYDLQGHGLSEGEAASIDHFSTYVLTLEKLMKKARDEMSGPFYVIGHSTGGAIAVNYLLKHHDHNFDKAILVAPLVRSNHWCLTKLGFYLSKLFPYIKRIDRRFRENSSNQNYLKFIQKDPLQSETIPIEWLSALINWNKNIQTYRATDMETCVLQGTKDETVAWKYNLRFVMEKFLHLKIVYIEDGKHSLFNESKHIRELVFANIHQFLMD
ncbi:alpha/beta hydrolase [Halobacillus naozhouensis]|uniref:Alpha/beta hydrolase n=1 Tax=Halobacillus naozhouensis TaxID=554880 RepID=A0ABY8J272_9BACI|nr:alpha/beta hydrolase [Halobacillus naozhouensis]WFT75488.1 alpha/beta hydrolase [Halobacillus naozhouensis]